MYSIAIDGPAGAGKSTIAKTIAKKLEFIYVKNVDDVLAHALMK